MQAKLYVGNLPYSTSADDLREMFSQAGTIKEVILVTDRETRRSKGFGFVEMTTQAEAEKAIQMFNDRDMQGRRMMVNIARPREDRGGSGGFGGGAGGRGRDRDSDR